MRSGFRRWWRSNAAQSRGFAAGVQPNNPRAHKWQVFARNGRNCILLGRHDSSKTDIQNWFWTTSGALSYNARRLLVFWWKTKGVVVLGAHHYKLHAVPQPLEVGVDAERLKEGYHWGDEQPPTAFLAELRNMLPKDTSWGCCEEFESESEWGSDIRIWHDDEVANNPVFSIDLRLSAGADGFSLLESFLNSTRKHGFQIYADQSGRILKPDLPAVLEDFRQSTAYRFLSSPEDAILDAAKNAEKSPRR